MKTLALALLGVVACLNNAEAQAPEASKIVVNGAAEVKSAPDQAWISIGAESRSKVSKEAQQRNAQAMTAVQQKLAGMGVPKNAIKTTAIDLQLEFDYADGKQTPRGYVARNTIEVRVDDLAKLGEVLDAVVSSGATMIHGLRFDIKDRSLLEAEALQAAVKNATSKGQALAAGAGRTVDRVLLIEEVSGSAPMPMMRQAVLAAGVAQSASPVMPGELEVHAQVRLTLLLK